MQKNFDHYLNSIKEYGTVEATRYPIVSIHGLPGAFLDEIVLFETGQFGIVNGLRENSVDALLMSRDPVSTKTRAVRTNEHLKIPVQNGILGSTINPLGEFTVKPMRQTQSKIEYRLIDQSSASLESRRRINKPLATGTAVIDLLVPIGKGQREVIAGSNGSGKSRFLRSAMKTQSEEGTIIVYAAIGKSTDEIRKLFTFITSQTNVENVVFIASSASDAPALIHLCPFSAMTIAEYFRDQGKHVLVILDDLTTHARFYREISLAAKRFPGRESFPGDMFHTHARILERAGNFFHPTYEEVSITCLAEVETIRENVTDHITSNLIGITDGHVLFDRAIFNQGRRPAVDIFLSVTRVGKQTQSSLLRQLGGELTRLITQYQHLIRYTQFGTELSEEVRIIIDKGEKLNVFFSQPSLLTLPIAVQVTMGVLILFGWFGNEINDRVVACRDLLADEYETNPKSRALMDSYALAASLKELMARLEKERAKVVSLCRLGRPISRRVPVPAR